MNTHVAPPVVSDGVVFVQVAEALATSPWAPVAAVAGQKQVLLFNMETFEVLGALPFPEGVAQVLRFSRNGSLLLAGGGFKRGHVHGATDEVGYEAVEDRMSVPDLHATILHQLGIGHDQLTYRHAGRDETLTDSVVTDAQVVHSILT